MNTKLQYFQDYLTCLAEDQPKNDELIPLLERQGNLLYELSQKVNHLIINTEIFFLLDEVFEALELDKEFQSKYLIEIEEEISGGLDNQCEILKFSNLEGGKLYYVSEVELLHNLFPESEVTLAAAYVKLQEKANELFEDVSPVECERKTDSGDEWFIR
ncbi:hypothetical protein [Priestia megaterium]|uniref:hypothetical protein n=1 Tax=Priestia megaterium TaxID=1404 RepID=UPI000BFDC9B4|nr:hypothetical protein [Priestia megaterium]PGQ88358.1 hypothetical protein COA18_05355 [Priestia megaterium]